MDDVNVSKFFKTEVDQPVEIMIIRFDYRSSLKNLVKINGDGSAIKVKTWNMSAKSHIKAP